MLRQPLTPSSGLGPSALAWPYSQAQLLCGHARRSRRAAGNAGLEPIARTQLTLERVIAPRPRIAGA